MALLISGAARSQQADQSAPSAGTALPEIVVQAPSPIRRPRPHPAAAPGHTTAAAPAAPPAPDPSTFPGTLPIVTDQFTTVTVVPNEEIRRSAAPTLGDLLNNKPGITGSSFAPGASSRPIIRGLDVNRVGIVENGIGSNGASDLGEDHFVPIDPLSTNQVEVIRGPATLRYGSQSIGGVVSATNSRIPETLPCSAVPSIQTYGYNVKAPQLSPSNPCASFETRTALSSVDQGREGAVLLDAAGNNVAIHADAFTRKTEDYSIPNSPYRFDPTRPFNGKQPNSSTQSDGASVGASYFFAGGFIGAAVQQNNSLYHIPGIEERKHRPDPEPAVESRSQHHRSIHRTRAEAGGTVLARRARCHRDLRYRQSESRHRDGEVRRSRIAEGDRAVPVRTDWLLHPVQRVHLSAADWQHLRRRVQHRRTRPRTQPGDLFPAGRHLPWRRIPVPV
jgi:iron complex outermembrane receptor protein